MRCLILGDAAGVHAEAAEAMRLLTFDAVFAVNNIGIAWPHVDVWATLHPEAVVNWCGLARGLELRERAGLNRPATWAHKPWLGVDMATPDWGGSSGLFAVKVALECAFDAIVLAGIPMSDGPHFYHDEPWKEMPRYRRAWQARAEELRPFVRSMSGWTREMFGAPQAT